MSLVTPPHSGGSVSDQVDQFTGSGRPMNNGATRSEQAPAATQQTGKLYKAVQVLGVLLFCAGLASCSAIVHGGSKDLDHLAGMYLAFTALLVGILLALCPGAFSTR